MHKIKEVIVVEGKDDINAVKRAVDAQLITTNGMGITEEILKQIETAAKRCGIIILTDPDFPGDKIRSIVSRRVKGCKHAYLKQDQARCKITGKIGVEYASPQVIKDALSAAKAEQFNSEANYTKQDLFNWGLVGLPFGGKRREMLADLLGIGKTNAKQFLRRLNSFNISRSEIEEALKELEGLELS